MGEVLKLTRVSYSPDKFKDTAVQLNTRFQGSRIPSFGALPWFNISLHLVNGQRTTVWVRFDVFMFPVPRFVVALFGDDR